MAKRTIKARIDKRGIKSFVDRINGLTSTMRVEDAQRMGKEVVAEMKDLISKGISPIAGVGRFPPYKHAGVKGKYPDNQKRKFPSKRSRPVNLFLSGKQMRALRFRVTRNKQGAGIEVGYFDSDEAKKEQGHREGVNDQPQRPTIPTGEEGFAEKIRRIVFRHFQESVSRYVKGK